jgi:hypothetical protein
VFIGILDFFVERMQACSIAVNTGHRAEADVHMVRVIGQRERVVLPRIGHQRDDLVGLHEALEPEQLAHDVVGDGALALVAEHRCAVDRGDVDGVAGGVLGDVAGGGEERVPAFERGDSGAELRQP